MLLKYGPEPTARTLLRELISRRPPIWQEMRAQQARIDLRVSGTADRSTNAVEGLTRPMTTGLAKSRIVQATTRSAGTGHSSSRQSDNAIAGCRSSSLLDVLAGGDFCKLQVFAEPSPIVIASILVFAFSVSSALFLIVDLSQPLTA